MDIIGCLKLKKNLLSIDLYTKIPVEVLIMLPCTYTQINLGCCLHIQKTVVVIIADALPIFLP